MARINEHYLKLQAGYLFPEIGRRVKEFASQNPKAEIIRLGIGDVTEPLTPTIVEAFHRGVDAMSQTQSFKGYGPEQGYDFLRESIAHHDYQIRGISIDPSEIFISDGSKCDTANIQEIFSSEAVIAVTDPVYPVYVDTNVMAGRTGAYKDGHYKGIVYLPCTAENTFNPPFPQFPVDLVYLCSPNNPTGTVLTKEQLKGWVDWARKNKAILLFDAAYEAYITQPGIPHSIFEIEGADEVAIEFRSFSKNAGFTGTRCAFIVIPKKLFAENIQGEKISIHTLWSRRHCTKFNGVSYPVQVAAAAVYSEQGKKEIRGLVTFYLKNAALIRDTLTKLGYTVFGGENAPYVWVQTKNKKTSWDFFNLLLKKIHVVGTPGSGFGPSGERYFRFSAFGSRANIEKAMERMKTLSSGEAAE
jgi:LL-diaminopimelate aminotransferase